MELLNTLREESFEAIELARNSVDRHFEFSEAKEMVKVAIGMRRSGKTFCVYQRIHQLLDSGITPEQILYVNFEDDRLLPMSSKEMGQLIDHFFTLHPENHTRDCYLFLDEVQNVEDWFLVVRRLHDKKKNAQLFLTGSSAKLLSTEIATSLRGRSLSKEVWPFSFSEYLDAHDIQPITKPMGKKSFDIMRQHLLRYFEIGGFPAVQTLNESEWRQTLQGYIDTVILRDIIERHNVSNVALLRYLTKSILSNAACRFSANKFHNDIKSQGYKVSKDTIYNYMEHLEDAYLIFSVPAYSESTRLRQTNPKKVYAIDNGIINATAVNIKDIYNKYLENLVYLDLRRQGKDVFYYNTKKGFEVDFLAVEPNGEKELIQVTWEMNDPKTEQREKRALESAQEELGIPARILTMKDYLQTYSL